MTEKPPVKALVIGWPVKHSRSPIIHNYWLQLYGIAAAYEKRAVEPANLSAFLRGMPKEGLLGCNITVPHKEEALGLVDSLDTLAQKVGAVNTVCVKKDGRLEGRNTDVHGFIENLKTANRAWKPKKRALVLGAGGAARAVLVGLSEHGAPEIFITNRTHDRARDLIAELQPRLKARLTLVGWPDREDILQDVRLVVNTTTQGMQGQDPLDLDLRNLQEGAVVTDLVYTPLLTPLLIEARRRGHVAIDGLGMLLHQAAPAFEGWFGIKPEITLALRQMVETLKR